MESRQGQPRGQGGGVEGGTSWQRLLLGVCVAISESCSLCRRLPDVSASGLRLPDFSGGFFVCFVLFYGYWCAFLISLAGFV